jgi:hypothetical protein
MEVAERFARGDETAAAARSLQVTVRSVQRWRKMWSEDGPQSLVLKGPTSLPLLNDELFAALKRDLDKGPVARGWPEQAWTPFPNQDLDRAPLPRATPSKTSRPRSSRPAGTSQVPPTPSH